MKLYDIELTYQAGRLGKIKARANCKARLTPKQIVVVSGEIVEGEYHQLGGLPYRFNRANGIPIPHPGPWAMSFWRPTTESMARMERQATKESEEPRTGRTTRQVWNRGAEPHFIFKGVARMLVLSRKPNEYIEIIRDGEVLLSFCIVDVEGTNVRLGFDAPPDVQVWRREVAERIESQREVK